MIVATSAAVLGAVATLGAWMAARAANQTGKSLAGIERHRWHADLTPQFEVTARASGDATAVLRVELVGPPGLDRLDQVAVSIRDDIRGRAPVTAGGPTAEQIAAQVWGPYRFAAGADGADPRGRAVASFDLLLGDWRPLALERTLPPMWTASSSGGGHRWRQQYDGKPVRITVHCRREGHGPWTVPLEIPVDAGDIPSA